MKVVFHERFHETYADEPAAVEGRLVPAVRELRGLYEFIEAQPVSVSDLARVHGRFHIDEIRQDSRIFPLALLAAGGTLQAAKLACAGEPAFALVRPPGHHASPDSCWGFCYFNNVAVALETLIEDGLIGSALVLDIDLHFGDGTSNFFSGRREVQYVHPEGSTRGEWLDACKEALDSARSADVIAVSAGFDRHEQDWGGLLCTGDFETVGRWVREWAGQRCQRRRFAVLEGGYNHETLAESILALLAGLG